MLPDGWKRVKIEDVFEETCEKNHPYAEVLTIIQGVGTVPREQSGREIVYDKNSLANYKFVKKGDFIIHLRSFEGGLEVANSDGIVSPAYIILHPKIEVSTIYLYALFHTNRFINQTMAPAVEGARDGRSVKYDVLKKQKIPFPPLSEQKKIAEILATQDKVIELKEKLVAEKQSQKKYLMSVLLGGDFKKTFKLNGVTIDKKKWEKKKLGDICDTFSGGTPSRYHPEYFNGNIPWIKSGELNQENVYETKEFLTKKGIESSSAKMVKKGTLLIAMYGATAGVLAVSHIDAAINQAILALIPNIDINPFYLKSAIANQIDVAVHRLVQGGQPNFNASIINSFELRLPSLPEQKAIAEVLSAADEEISLLQKDLEQEKLKKKSLMQLLLTGLVRVQ
jgi:type I restriction enzyme S subunit